jgi:hypothetical protein
MRSKIKTLIWGAILANSTIWMFPASAEAGPLLDWLRGCCKKDKAPAPMMAQNPYGLQPGQCMQTCQQTCSRTVVNYVPYTAYRTEWKQVPVTQYRPVTSSDPCTGCTVTCMRPCTTYTYQAQRVPYTTYRPEYRTETYQVPVTTITNDCYTGTCSTPGVMPAGVMPAQPNCATCVPGYQMPANQVPSLTPGMSPTGPNSGTYYEYPATTPPRGSSLPGTGSVYQSNVVPADTIPTLNPQSSVTPVYERMQTNDATRQMSPATYQQPTPAYFPGQSAENPVRREWNYSPVRLASHSTEINYIDDQSISVVEQPMSVIEPTVQYRAEFKPVVSSDSGSTNDLNGWKLVK